MTEDDFKKEWTEQGFKNHVWKRIGQNNDLYPNWMLKEFCEHWCEKPYNARKMTWQKVKGKTFIISMRLAKWKSNSMEWHPKKWKAKDTPMKPVKWLRTNESESAKEESKEIKNGYDRLKKIAETNEPRESVSLVKQHIMNMGRPVTKRNKINSEEDYQKFKAELVEKNSKA